MTTDSDRLHLRCSYNRASGVVSRNGLLMQAPLCGAESERIVACRWIGLYSFDDICADCCDIHERVLLMVSGIRYNGTQTAI